MGHANRTKRNRTAASNPVPSEVRAARAAAKHDIRLASSTVYANPANWEEWENDRGQRKMHPAFFELYLLKTGQKTIDQVQEEHAQRALGIIASQESREDLVDEIDDNRGNR